MGPCGAYPGEADVSLRGSYGTKLEAVVRRVLAILQAEPEARILVFSSWQVGAQRALLQSRC